MRWDAIKEDIHVWAFSKHNKKLSSSFHGKPPIATCLGPLVNSAPKTSFDRVIHTTAGKENMRAIKLLQVHPRGRLHLCPWVLALAMPGFATWQGVYPVPWSPKLQRAHQGHSKIESEKSHTPLQYTSLESELKDHPDKSWSSHLLKSIKSGVSLHVGYEGPRGLMEAQKLLSARTHLTVVDHEIQQEC